MFRRVARGGRRVWCFTPIPVRERKFVVGLGRVEVSAGGKGRNVARQLRAWGIPAISKTIFDGLVPGSDVGSDHRERVGWALVKEGVELLNAVQDVYLAKEIDIA